MYSFCQLCGTMTLPLTTTDKFFNDSDQTTFMEMTIRNL